MPQGKARTLLLSGAGDSPEVQVTNGTDVSGKWGSWSGMVSSCISLSFNLKGGLA